MVIKATL